MEATDNATHREPWNKGKIVSQKAAFKLPDIWALWGRLQMQNRVRELALFNLGIDYGAALMQRVGRFCSRGSMAGAGVQSAAQLRMGVSLRRQPSARTLIRPEQHRSGGSILNTRPMRTTFAARGRHHG